MVEFHQTPEGMVVDVEVVVGSPPRGWDERNRRNGNTLARAINSGLMEPQLRTQRGTLDWEESINAITRHMVRLGCCMRLHLGVCVISHLWLILLDALYMPQTTQIALCC